MIRNLILSGGIYHPFDKTSAMLADLLAPLGVESEIVEVRGGLARLAAGETFDMLTVNALCWSMTQNEKYEPYREDQAHEITAAERAAVTAHVEAGRPLLAMHTAPICFDDWPEWGALIGARWVWGQSGHPAPCPVTVAVGGEPFTLEDELYCNLVLSSDAKVMATATAEGVDAAQPVLIQRSTPDVRVIYDALGHDERSFSDPNHRALIVEAAEQLIGQTAEAAT